LDATQIRVTIENDSEKVEDLALGPIRRFPKIADRGKMLAIA
jgi:hypothetical protein